MTKVTVSALIPAFNEEQTISHIINNVLSQQAEHFILEKILVITDGCSDKTADVARSIQDPRLSVIEHSDRRGKANRLNQHILEINSDLIVQLDADTSLHDTLALEHLVRPFLNNPSVGITCGDHQFFKPENFIQKIAGISYGLFNKTKDDLGERAIRYRCNGRLLCIRTSVAKKIKIPTNVSTDLYTFYAVVEKGHKVVFCPEAVTYYHLVGTYSDFIKQNKRYHKDNVKQYFPPQLYKQYATMNARHKLAAVVKAVTTGEYPLHLVLIVIAFYHLSLFASLSYRRGPLWPMSPSTKKLQKSHVV